MSARLFQPRSDLASQFGWVPMPALLQRLFSSLAHPLTKPIGGGLTEQEGVSESHAPTHASGETIPLFFKRGTDQVQPRPA